MTTIEATKEITWSPQQQAFLDWVSHGSGSCALEAVAGAGKTTTLLEAAQRIRGQVAIMAFNKKIADEIKAKLEKLDIGWRKAQAGTVHSFGFSCLRRAYEQNGVKLQVTAEKVRNIAENMYPPEHDLRDFLGMMVKLVGLAKQRALGIMGQIEDYSQWADIADHFDVFTAFNDGEQDTIPEQDIIEAAMVLLRKSNSIRHVVDFDDMVYMPLIHRLKFWQFDVVMVDEAQDTNPARRAMVRAMLKRGGRVIAVGDRHQAIYGFTGADNDSLELIANDFDCCQLPLTVSYRCPQSVVEFAQQWVSHIQAHEDAPDGEVSETEMRDFLARKDLDGDSAVLCRNTKPLVSLALRLIRNKTACRVEGRDIGQNLKKLSQRWKVNSLDALENKLDEYLERETTKLLAKKQEVKLQQVEDTVQTLLVIIDQCRQEGKHHPSCVADYVDRLFEDNVSGMLVLSTIHKSKGREWERVFWLDRAGTCPSRWARQEWQYDQEINLMYVAATRAKHTLIDLYPDPEKR